jgi:hypothetical protein
VNEEKTEQKDKIKEHSPRTLYSVVASKLCPVRSIDPHSAPVVQIFVLPSGHQFFVFIPKAENAEVEL